MLLDPEQDFDQNTPILVIAEMAESMGYKVDPTLTSPNYIQGLLDGIENYQTRVHGRIEFILDKESKMPLQENDNLAKIAKFVNSDNHDWTLNALNQAFQHLVLFFQQTKTRYEIDFKPGRKTPQCPMNYDACMLYKICLSRGLTTHRNMSLQDMSELIALYNTSKQDLIQMILKQKGRGICLPWDPQREVDSTSQTYRSFFQNGDIRTIFLNKYQPMDHSEAVVFAQIRFGINIFNALSPLDEYKHMSGQAIDSLGQNYHPQDLSMKKLLSRDPSWILPSPDKWISPLLKSYKPFKLRSLAQLEGYRESEDLIRPEESLGELSEKNHIYLGIHPFIRLDKIETLIFRDRIESVQDSEDILISLGKTAHPGDLSVLTLNELCDWFESEKSFCLPNNRYYYFNDVTVAKLCTMCETSMKEHRGRQQEIPKSIWRMYGLISSIRQLESDVYDHIEKIKRLPADDQDSFKLYLSMIKDLAYYMRGWRVGGNEDAPLDSNQTQTDQGDFSEIEKNCSFQFLAIAEVYNNWSQEIRDLMDRIFLMVQKEKDGQSIYIKSNSQEVGRTLVEKLNIVKEDNNDNSCIRLSSNYILYTVWFYYKECFGEELFPMAKVSFIS